MPSERYAKCQLMKSTDKSPPYTVTSRDNTLSLSRCLLGVLKKHAYGHSNRGSAFLRISELHGR
jgi:hypothetical protein